MSSKVECRNVGASHSVVVGKPAGQERYDQFGIYVNTLGSHRHDAVLRVPVVEIGADSWELNTNMFSGRWRNK